MAETLEECPQCKVSDQLVKLVTQFRTAPKSNHSAPQATGHLTEEYIKESRDELKLQKQELEKNR